MIRAEPTSLLYAHFVMSDSDAVSTYSPFKTVGGRWLHLVEAGEDGLDEDTVAALTIELAKLADRIDVACIAHSSGSAP